MGFGLRPLAFDFGPRTFDFGLSTLDLDLAAGEGFEPSLLRSERSVLPGYTIPQQNFRLKISDLQWSSFEQPTI